MLEQYPNEVIVYVTDPRTGVQRSLRWPPTISEIVDACDARVSELKRNERYENWGGGNDWGEPLLAAPLEKRSTIEELKAKHGDNWGLSEPAPKPTWRAPDILTVAAEMRADPSRLQRLLNTDRQKERAAREADIEAERKQANIDWGHESQSYGNEGS